MLLPSASATRRRQVASSTKSASALPSEDEYLPMHIKPCRRSSGHVAMISRHSAAHAAGSQPDLDVSAEVFTYMGHPKSYVR